MYRVVRGIIMKGAGIEALYPQVIGIIIFGTAGFLVFGGSGFQTE